MSMPGHFASGDPLKLSARFVNDLMKPRPTNSGSGPIQFRRETAKVYVRNMTGENVLAGVPLALGDPVFNVTPSNPSSVQVFFDQPILEARKPDEDTLGWGMLQQALIHDDERGGECGWLILTGVSPARIKGPPDVGWCGWKADSFYLHTDEAAEARILWEGESEVSGNPAGERNALVLIGQGEGQMEGRLLTDLPAPEEFGQKTTGTMQVWRYDKATEELVDTGITKTIHNFDPSCEGVVGAYIWAKRKDGLWRAMWLGCPD